MNILEVRKLNIGFNMYDRAMNRKHYPAVFDLDIDVKKGEIHAVAGSSGSGKSLMAHAILGILPPNATVRAEMKFKGEDLDNKMLAKLRGDEMAFVPQSVAYLDPLMRVGDQLKIRGSGDEEIMSVIEMLGFEKKDLKKFPFQLSGGMARRILIANAMLSKASLIVADEPTPGLSLDLAAEVLNHFRTMANQGRGVLLITHDIDLVCKVADRMSVFYGGRILETLDTADFINGPEFIKHPLTKAFWRALPQNGFNDTEMSAIEAECIKMGVEMPNPEEFI